MEKPQVCNCPSLSGTQFPGCPVGVSLEGVLGLPGSQGLALEGVMSREPSWPAFWQHHPSHPWHWAWAALKGAQRAWLPLLSEASSHLSTPGAPKVSSHWAVASPDTQACACDTAGRW